MKKLLTTLTALLSSVACIAAQTQSTLKTFRQDPFDHPMFPAYLITLLGIVVLVLWIIAGIYMILASCVLKNKCLVTRAKRPER